MLAVESRLSYLSDVCRENDVSHGRRESLSGGVPVLAAHQGLTPAFADRQLTQAAMQAGEEGHPDASGQKGRHAIDQAPHHA